MIVDTSAIVAILYAEPERDALILSLLLAPNRAMSAGSLIELSAVLTRRGLPGAVAKADALLAKLGIEIEPVTVEQARIGQTAYQLYGRGTGHAASLNFGDCFAYALAKATGRPLLYKGDDFAATDIATAA